jgi:hypothetical protein
MPGLIREYHRRDQESALPALPTDMQRFYLSQQPLVPDKLEIRATPSIISQAQYEEAINCYHEYHAQGKGEGRSILALLRDVDAPMRLYNGVQGILQYYIREKLIPYNYSGDVTDVFFAAYFTGEDLLGLRNFGVKALLEFKKIMAQNGLLFK